jgi:hypothetical protein
MNVLAGRREHLGRRARQAAIAIAVFVVLSIVAVAVLLGEGRKDEAATVTVEPSSGPLGTSLTITGTGLTEAARAQSREGVTVFFVRPEGDLLRIAPMWTLELAPDGNFGLQLPVPYDLELFPPPAAGESTPRVIKTTSGNLQIAVGSPSNRIAGAVFRVREAQVGVPYPHRLVNKCTVLATVFDGQLWVSDPPAPVGPNGGSAGWRNERDLPGTFTLVSSDLAEFRNFAGETARLRRSMESPQGCGT